jgi:histidine triad (HIT) family protein
MNTPPVAQDPAADARAEACLFCRIVAGAVPADVIAQDGAAIAFRDIDPRAPLHVLVVPREHHRDVGALAESDPAALTAVVRLAARVAGQHVEGGYRLVFNTGAEGGQTVGHVHAHVLGGRPMTWPPG